MFNPIRHSKKITNLFAWIAAGSILIFGLAPLPVLALTLDQGVPPVQLPANSAALGLQDAFIDVAAKVSPAVVNIGSEWTEDVQGYGNMNDLFNFFYGQHGMGQQQNPVFKRKQQALGSGFLVTSDGYILTNAHVVGKAEKITVTMQDGTTYPAKIIGKYDKVDIAVIKIVDINKVFPHVVFGNSDNIKVGQWAVAIGNPFGLDHTVTTGVISAKGRSVEIGEGEGENGGGGSGVQNYIQTDASINPGNSGGPLCNIEGEVIGVNSAIYSQSGGSVGIGFAVPSNTARKTAEDLVNNNGKIVRAGLGAVVQSLSPAMAKSFGLSSNQGALLSDINAGSAAEKADLKAGDVVLAFNGSPITDSGDLVSRLYTYHQGDIITLTIQRNGIQSDIPVTLQQLDEAALEKKGEDTGDNPNGLSGQGQSEALGLAYEDQTPDIRTQLPAGTHTGPIVTQVDPQGPAAASGLQHGDIILKLGNSPVVSSNQLTVLLKKSDLKSGVRLFVWRNGETLYTILQSGDE
jgi:serine protease Do